MLNLEKPYHKDGLEEVGLGIDGAGGRADWSSGAQAAATQDGRHCEELGPNRDRRWAKGNRIAPVLPEAEISHKAARRR